MKLRACAVLLCFAAMASSAACDSSHAPAPAAPCPEVDPAAPVDSVLLAFLGKARAAHHSADILEQQTNVQAAVKTLASLVSSPDSLLDRPEAREVLADTRARLADLRSRLGQFDEAMSDVEAGLRLVKGPSYFRGHLFEMRGLVIERQAAALRKDGDEAAAKRAEAAALQAFEEAMKLQQQVLDAAQPDAGSQ